MNFESEVIHHTFCLYIWFGSRLEANGGEEDESGSTATVMFIRNDVSFIAHIGDSCAVSLFIN